MALSPSPFSADALRPGQLVAHYLMSSYLYYICDQSPIPDSEFDRICVRLMQEWDSIEHPHKGLIDLAALVTGSGYHLRLNDYPLMTRNAADQWAASLEMSR